MAGIQDARIIQNIRLAVVIAIATRMHSCTQMCVLSLKLHVSCVTSLVIMRLLCAYEEMWREEEGGEACQVGQLFSHVRVGVSC